jgi:probable rRNA maturation factor
MIVIELNQQCLKGGMRFRDARLVQIAKEVSKALKLKRAHHISAAFVSQKDMKRLNFQHRGKNTVTDVLSFTLNNDDYFGEIILSYDQAKKQAKEMKHSVRDEVAFLLVHGLLHVFGFDHEVELGAKKMFSLQTAILKKLNVDPRI